MPIMRLCFFSFRFVEMLRELDFSASAVGFALADASAVVFDRVACFFVVDLGFFVIVYRRFILWFFCVTELISVVDFLIGLLVAWFNVLLLCSAFG
ncbi:hypothetical protein [Bacillus sp. UNC438CL73TsuS30]|uniref:hypothetical protein n=1 Tax=Bacillus sp. UNC438CL73TsuS30 TaxID=1340434 RepID=UPI0012DE82A3|nr:hypothetical protein [Bacillus sp. UNC438CL73TsuS30]